MGSFITSKEIESRLKVSYKFVILHRQELGGFRLGHRTWRFPPDAVERFIDARKQKNAQVRHTLAVRQEDPGTQINQPIHLSDKERGSEGRINHPVQIFRNRDNRINAAISRLNGH